MIPARVIRLAGSLRWTVVAALGAAHETGHACSMRNYLPLALRNIFPWPYPVPRWLPLVSWDYSSKRAGLGWLLDLGILFFLTAILFQVITLPVEFNARPRAMGMLTTGGVRSRRSGPDPGDLSAAALTYVAAVAVAVGELRLLILRNSRRD